MGEHLSENDWERIREFAKTPAYERSPEILSEANEGDDPESRTHGGDEDE
ncbi:MAG: hypothetical protein ACOCPT_03545 [Halanaeroarchaeum sp.]